MAEPEEFELIDNKKGKADVWKNFWLKLSKVTKKIVDNVAVCRRCKVEIKFAGGTSNLTAHMRRHHPTVNCVKIARNNNDKDKSRDIPPISDVGSLSASFSQQQTTLTGMFAAKYHCSSPKAYRITNQISKFIIKDLRPYSIVDGDEFRKLINILDPRYSVPSRKQFSEVEIPKLYNKIFVDEVKQELRSPDVMQVALTTDGWTSRAVESYVTVTSCHMKEDWSLRSYVLQTRQLPESHTAVNLATVILDSITEWNIPVHLPVPIVSDNASNMIKCVELINETVPTFHVKCFAHTLNLAAQKALKVKRVSHLLARVRKTVSFFHRSTTATALLKTQASLLSLPSHKLIIDVATRWNSAYDMVARFLEMQCAVISTLRCKDLKCKDKADLATLSDDDVSLAEEVVNCLEPLKIMTTALCTESAPTVSIILPLQERLLNHLMQPKDGDSAAVVEMKKAVHDDLCDRYVKEKDTLLLAASLDPRFKSLPFIDEELKFDTFNRLASEAAKLSEFQHVSTPQIPQSAANGDITMPPLPHLDGICENNQNQVSVVHDQPTIPPCKKRRLSSLCDVLGGDCYKTKQEPPKPTLVIAQEQVTTYRALETLELSNNPLSWWKENQHKCPLIAKLAMCFLSIPATSVPSERVFSTAGDIVTAQRSLLKGTHVDKLIFLKKNMK